MSLSVWHPPVHVCVCLYCVQRLQISGKKISSFEEKTQGQIKSTICWPADGIGAEKVHSTWQQQGWYGWTVEVGHHSLWNEQTNKEIKMTPGPVRCERISGWSASVQTPNPLSGMAASLKKEIKWISSPLVAQIILHFNAASSGGTNAQLCESLEDNLRIKFSDATFISDRGGIILWRKAKVKLRVKDVLEPGAGQSIGLENPRPINELFRDSQNSQIFTFHSRQLSEGRILSHLFNGKLTLKWVTTGYTICPT